MKKNVLICIMILGVLSSIAQTPLPNFGFENWTKVKGRLSPNNWLGRDTTVSRTTDKYAGNYAARIQNILRGVVQGDTSKGILASLPPDSAESMNPAFPVNVKHTTLNGYYKFTPVKGDSCQFIVFIYKHGYVNAQSFNLLGGGWKSYGAESTYTPFTLNINYFDSTGTIMPDSADISLNAYKEINFTTGKELKPIGNSVLYVDNISFDGFIQGINNIPDMVKEVSVFPNPASALLNISMQLKESDYNVSLYDMNGRLIRTIANGRLSGYQQLSVNIEDIPAGDYILMISTNDGYFNKKVSVIK